MADELYEKLTAPFEGYYTAEGVFGPFLSGEQVASRLNHVLGVGNWSFSVLDFKIEHEDEVVALGELKAYVSGQWLHRQQFGGQKIKRVKATGMPSNLADDHKGAATDALKKCASLLGVGLYLMVSSATWHQGVPPTAQANEDKRTGRSAAPRPTAAPRGPGAATNGTGGALVAPAEPSDNTAPVSNVKCMQCERPLQEVSFPPKEGKPGETWTISKLRTQSVRRFASVLCFPCFREGVEYERKMGKATAG